jgi:hypothetical protein
MAEVSTFTREEIIALLRENRQKLEAAGILHAALIGSVARGEATADSDIDLMVEVDPARRPRGYASIGFRRDLKDRLRTLLGREVDMLEAPISEPRLRAEIERDAVRAF